MELYFSPLACSLASRIALIEAGLAEDTRFHNVTLATKRTDDGRDYWQVTAKGKVPALVTDDGALLTENAAVLQYIADRAPEGRLAPPQGSAGRYKLQEWLHFIGTELHKLIFTPVFTPAVPQAMRDYVLANELPARLALLDDHFAAGNTYLLGAEFSVADAYLLVVLNWVRFVEVDLAPYPWLSDYATRLTAHPSVARAMAEEVPLSEHLAQQPAKAQASSSASQ